MLSPIFSDSGVGLVYRLDVLASSADCSIALEILVIIYAPILRRRGESFFLSSQVCFDCHGAQAMGQKREVIFEFISIGSYVKVSAIDTRTGTEVSIVGDPRRGEVALRRVALRKLENVMKKASESGRPGRLV